jgi:protein-disulfide isomerase
MNTNYLIPLSIIIAGGLIAGAVFYSRPGGLPGSVPSDDVKAGVAQALRGGGNMRTVDASDHIRGNPDAAVKIVEYSDLECPFCKRFHSTMQQVVEEYGKDGRVAWVYRHFPLDALHSKARKEAEATECANDLGGNTAFWTYIDKLIAITPSNNQLDPNQLPVIAGDIGLNREAFQTCLDAGKFADRVSADLSDAQAAGGSGTPYSIAIAKNGEKFPINGAQPYEEVKRIIELALQAK